MRKLALSLACCLLYASVAQATILNTWNNQASFLAGTAGQTLAMESFESLTNGTGLPLTTSGGITISTTNTSYGSFNSVTNLMASDGSMSIRAGLDSGDSVYFDFNSGITTLGLYILDFGTTGDNPALTFFDSNGDVVGALSGTGPTFNQQFFGVETSEAFTRAEFRYSGANGDGVYFDQLYTGSNGAPVPEPSTMLLLGGGLAGLAFWRRSKK